MNWLDERVTMVDAAGGVDLTGEGDHGAGGQSDDMVDLGLVLTHPVSSAWTGTQKSTVPTVVVFLE